MHRFYAQRSISTDNAFVLGETEAHHLRDVLRHSAGAEILVFDGDGGEYLCAVDAIGKKSATARIIREVDPTSPESPLDLTLAAAVLKGEKFDLVVKKSVELGVARLKPIITTRCDVRIGEGCGRRDRWHRIAIDAARQCGRATLMKVDEPRSYADIAAGSTGGDSILFSERSGRKLSDISAGKKITAFVGPEGGWDDTELAIAAGRNISIVTLGGRLMRAETAAIAITAILQNHFGDIC